ncbi:MAG: 50S ribosomal protein L9 [Lachnospiraceae bacterium]|nr:50S ribosomal protein L9 [Cuneatibacter sp.]MDD6455068.1 50S ribosomal protein L9 [Lachnospiraceae bacterium]
MEIILLEDVKSLGKKGQKVTVSDGYARNFILPKKLGIEANAKNLNDLKLKQANDAKVEAQKIADAKALAESLKEKAVILKIRSGEGGKLFGSVSTKEIAEAAKAQLGLDLDKKKMQQTEPIKTLGTHIIPIKLYKEVSGELTVKVTEQ